jgi:dCMP deaminase
MKKRDIELYMDIADRVSQQSRAVRAKVGAVFVAESGVLSIGYNGTLPGCDNECEIRVGTELVTKPDVYHAEENIFSKLLEEGVSAKGGSVFLTMEPCLPCSKLIRGAKVKNVYYRDSYRSHAGAEFLSANGINVVQV